MSLLPVEKGVPLPETRGRTRVYPWREMEVGDSFFVIGKPLSGFMGSATRYRPLEFTARTLTENGVKGVRVWRVA